MNYYKLEKLANWLTNRFRRRKVRSVITMKEIEKLKEELEQIKLLLNNGEIELVNRLLRYNRAINAIEELAKNNDKVNSKEIEKIIKRIEK